MEGGATVLIVDDDEAILGMLSSFLRRQGYRVLSAGNPLKALELLEQETVQLVLTDLMMPHVDGIDFTQRVHLLPRHKDVPVILITAHGDEAVADRGMRKGVALTLPKPIDLGRLLDLVRFATTR